MKHLACLATLALLCACPTSQPVDAGTPDPGPVDAGFDAGVPDAGPANPYLVTLWDHARITSKQGEPNFQRLTLPLPQLHGGPFSYVTLVADLESTCFPFSKWATTPPPSGQNWPADCDAFDRNYEFMLRTPDAGTLADGGTPPGLELVRAITPFGGPLNLEVDVTDVFNAVDGPRVLEVTIPTWSDGAGRVSGSNGGWFVTARFEVGPGPMPRKVLGVIPLLDLSATSTNRDLQQTFTLPAGTKRTRLEYRVTGHGGATATGTGTGCIGPAEEFCMRGHVLSADGVELVSYSPWRTDCTAKCTLVTGPGPSGSAFQYCQENPCGSINSVRAPRANWCPGSQTPPHVETPATWKTPGDHTFRAVIDTIEPGGLWRITAHVIAYGE
jgi:hypothetical protein